MQVSAVVQCNCMKLVGSPAAMAWQRQGHCSDLHAAWALSAVKVTFSVTDQHLTALLYATHLLAQAAAAAAVV